MYGTVDVPVTRKRKCIWKEDGSSDKHNRALWLTIGHCFDLHDRENLCCWFVLDVVCGHRNNFSRRVIFRGSRLSNGLSLRRLSFFEVCRLKIFFLHEDMRLAIVILLPLETCINKNADHYRWMGSVGDYITLLNAK